MAEQQVTNLGTRAAPLTRVTKDSEELVLLNVKASFDGSAAASAFVPAVRILSDSGQEVGTYPADDQVSAGGSADATFAPFLRNRRGDIRFNRENVGTFLHVTASADIDLETHAMFLYALGFAAVMEVLSEGSLLLEGDTQIELNSDGAWLISVDSVLEAIATICSITVGSGGWSLDTSGPVGISTAGGSSDVTIRVPNGASLEVQDVATNPIFRVNSDGSLQGKTGKALTFNL